MRASERHVIRLAASRSRKARHPSASQPLRKSAHCAIARMRFSVQERVYIVRMYWVTGSFKECQKEFLKRFGGPSKSNISFLARKLETTGSLVDAHGGGKPKMSDETVQDVKDRLLQSPKRLSLRRLAQETGKSYSTCQRAAKKAKCKPYRVTVVHELKPPDLQKRSAYCTWFQQFFRQNPTLLDITWFTDEAWFSLSGYVNS